MDKEMIWYKTLYPWIYSKLLKAYRGPLYFEEWANVGLYNVSAYQGKPYTVSIKS